jgi:hypothetical protein
VFHDAFLTSVLKRILTTQDQRDLLRRRAAVDVHRPDIVPGDLSLTGIAADLTYGLNELLTPARATAMQLAG